MATILYTPSTPATSDLIALTLTGGTVGQKYTWTLTDSAGNDIKGKLTMEPDTLSGIFDTADLPSDDYSVWVDAGAVATVAITLRSAGSSINSVSDSIAKLATDGIKVSAAKTSPTDDQAFWVKIRQCTSRRGFKKYAEFIDKNLCLGQKTTSSTSPDLTALLKSDCQYSHGVHGYEILKAATEVFLLCESCCSEMTLENIDPDDEEARLGYTPTQQEMADALKDYLSPSTLRLPYLDTILTNLGLTPSGRFPFCEDSARLSMCLYELIWSYWQEQGMLAQTMNAIALRFQNRRVPGNGRDPLSNMEIAPLRPLSNLLWGYIQDGADGRRLTVARRAYEYSHEYGLDLVGKAVGDMQPAESRSRFVEAFHNLLYLCADYYRENTNQWITPDPYPLLDALRSVHILLAEGAHNQFGDLPTTARAEMMIEQWLLSRPPMNEFLQSRAMVPYDEAWMGQVDAMRRLMAWPDVSSMYFNRLAVYGEQILLSIRWGNWSGLTTTSDQAANWALYWKPEIQGYIEAYRAVTKVELAPSFRASVPVDTSQPSAHLSRRMSEDGVKVGRS